MDKPTSVVSLLVVMALVFGATACMPSDPTTGQPTPITDPEATPAETPPEDEVDETPSGLELPTPLFDLPTPKPTLDVPPPRYDE